MQISSVQCAVYLLIDAFHINQCSHLNQSRQVFCILLRTCIALKTRAELYPGARPAFRMICKVQVNERPLIDNWFLALATSSDLGCYWCSLRHETRAQALHFSRHRLPPVYLRNIRGAGLLFDYFEIHECAMLECMRIACSVAALKTRVLLAYRLGPFGASH